MNTTIKQKCKKASDAFLLMRHHYVCLFFILFLARTTFAQIVPNGSFETNTCNGSFNCVTSWKSATTWGTPDYYTRAAHRVPVTGIGYQETQPSGEKGFVGILSGKFPGGSDPVYREYLQAHLNTPLTENKCYKVKFYVSLTLSAGNSYSFIKRLGAFFSGYAVSATGYPVLQFTPQVASNAWLNDSANWTLIEGCFKVPDDSTFNFITIGNFENNPDVTNVVGTEFRAYYFIDAVSVDSVTSNSAFTHSTPTCGLPVNFTSSDGSDTHSWDFGDGSTSTDVNPSHSYNGGGVFIVKHMVSSGSCGCGSTTVDTIKILNCCMCENCGTDLVRNGHFSDPCHTAYSSELTAIACPNAYTEPDQYTEATDAALCYHIFCGKDHTGTPGSKILVVDGHFEFRPFPSPPTLKAWYQKVGKVKKNHHYCFIAYAKNICRNCADKPSLKLQIDDHGTKYIVDAIDDLAYNECCDAGWTKMCGSWTAPADIDSIELSVLITQGLWMGNDAGIDDISFSESDTKPSANFKDSGSFCVNTKVFFTSDNKTGSHNWTFGDGGSSTLVNPTHTYTRTGTFTVKHIISTPCGNDTVTKIVTIVDCCCKVCNTNLISNPSFNSVTSCFTGYSTDLQYNYCVPVYSHSDSITEHVNAQSVIPGWYGLDHTGTSGSRLLIIDFPYNTVKRGWYTNVPVIPGKTYCYSMYVKNLAIYSSPVNSPTFDLRVKGISGTLIKNVTQLPFDSSWTKICGEWTAGMSDVSVELDLVVYPGIGAGFDLGVDDISFAEKCADSSGGGGGGGGLPAPSGTNKGSTTGETGLQSNDPSLSISPIPVKRGTSLQLSFFSPKDDKVNIAIYDENGKMTKQLNESFTQGNNQVSIPTNEFSPGMYYLRLSSSAEMMTRKIIVTE